ncbi:peptidoglycan recognition protein 4 [Alligator mississippiensis]|uniref:Peptidoglycan-recognition protein n=1 Tax=Alligator mississippiensis TaxID=8496 RepID=A0A151PJQ6_ALLMI|nr:peptidoglycan recognition protein 4 [Alligator mississippiensis]KYO48995.1 peptidoglycan recognition protein 3 [Alligator mississippiensis]
MMLRLAVLFSALCASSCQLACPPIISPAKWGSRPAKCAAPLSKVPPGNVIIIHTSGSACHTQPECSELLRNIQVFHRDMKEWCDISYNFLIGEDGNVYEGRGWLLEGAHTYGYNDLSLGIAFIGNFTERSPNEAAWKTLKNLLTYAVQSGYLASDYLLMAHSDVSNTISPGKLIRETIKMWPHYKH